MKKDKITPRKFIYHFSNPMNRDFISKNGLKARGKTEAWISDTNIDGKAIFFSNTNKKAELFETGYNDDLYIVDTSQLDINFFIDPNINSETYIYCQEDIPSKYIELIYKGDGQSLDDLRIFLINLLEGIDLK